MPESTKGSSKSRKEGTSIKQYDLSTIKCSIDINTFCEELTHLLSKYGLEKNFTLFFHEIKKEGKDKAFESHGSDDFGLSKGLETLFFKNLLGEVRKDCLLTKYTNLDCLKFIYNDNEMGMTSLAGMNDSTECYYADSYLKKHGSISVFSESDNIYWGLHTFITSFTDLQDDLTMWRLYGNDASGINLQFKLETDLGDEFILLPVSYAEEDGNHPRLDLISEMQQITIEGRRFEFRHFYAWRYFFKPFQYRVENEIRLLYMKDKSDEHIIWTHTGVGIITSLAKFTIEDKSTDLEDNKHPLYPLTLRGITLGPQFIESKFNLEAIKIMLQEKFGWLDKDIKIKPSDIENYRSTKK